MLIEITVFMKIEDYYNDSKQQRGCMSIRIECHNIYGGTDVYRFDGDKTQTIVEATQKFAELRTSGHNVVSIIDNDSGDYLDPRQLYTTTVRQR